MSNDDRFKQARRSLLNQQRQGQPRQGPPPTPSGFEEEHTELVNVDALRQGAQNQQMYQETDEEAKTAMVDVSSLRAGQPGPPQGFEPDVPRVPASRSGRHALAQRPAPPVHQAPRPTHPPQQHPHSFQETPMSGGDSEVDSEEKTAFIEMGVSPFENSFGSPPPNPGVNPNARTEALPAVGGGYAPYGGLDMESSEARTEAMPSIIPGSMHSHGGTFTMDTNDVEFIEEVPHAPSIVIGGEESEPNYGASTQAFDLNELQAGAGAISQGMPSPGMPTPGFGQGMPTPGMGVAPQGGPSVPIQQDSLLRNAYQFDPSQIQRVGAITLIHAQNAQGAPVILKQIWSQAPDLMPQALHEQVSKLGALEAPALVKMHGMFTSHSGRWIELEGTKGETLSQIIQTQGPLKPDRIKWWAHQVARALDAIHNAGLLHLNLTPDAIWINETTQQVYLEPFDLFVLKERGNLGVFGAQELHRSGTHEPSQATDLYSLAMLLIYALTGQTDHKYLTSIENKATRNTLAKAIDPNPTKRAKTAMSIIQAGKLMPAGERISPLDKRILLPVTALVVIATMAWTFLAPDGPPPPPRQVNFKAAPDADRVAGKSPGKIEEDKRIVVLESFAYSPAEEGKSTDEEKDSEKVASYMKKANEELGKSSPDPKRVLSLYTSAVRAGASDEQELELVTKIRNNEEVLDYYRGKLLDFESKLWTQKRLDVDLRRQYGNLAKIIPNAKNYLFLSKNSTAPIKKISTPKQAKPKPKDKE